MIDRVGLPLELHDAMAQHQGTMSAAGINQSINIPTFFS
jgi:hypothetical protein